MPVDIGPTINTLSLPSPYEENADIEKPYVVGWGYSDGISPSVLQELELKIVPTHKCTEVYRKVRSRQYAKILASGQIKEEDLVYLVETLASVFSTLESQICAEGHSFGKDTCHGDSGGPLFMLDRLNGR